MYKISRKTLEAKLASLKKPQHQFSTTLFLAEGKARQGEGGLRTKGYFKGGKRGEPLITVITVVFNGENDLEDTILSVINQTYRGVEYILIDGGSTDGTLDIVRKYDYAIDYWISEKDNGIYDAMNKSLTLSTGEFIIHLNSGDQLYKNSLTDVFSFRHEHYAAITGKVKYDSGRIFHPNPSFLIIKNTLHHQATFYSLETIKCIGLYDLEYKILADYHLNCKIYKEGYALKVESVIVSICSKLGVSDIPNKKNYLEEMKIREKIFGVNVVTLSLRFYSYFRCYWKKVKHLLCHYTYRLY